MLGVCTVNPVSKNFELTSKTGGAEFRLLLVDESGPKPRMTSVSQNKLLVTRFIDWIQYTVYSEVFSIRDVNCEKFKLIPVLSFVRLQW